MSSKRHLRRRSCESKRAYPTQQAAWGGLKRTAGSGLLLYRCRWCGQYHVGHPPARVRQAIAAKRRNEAAAV
jgi:hypothetical protein